MVAHEGQAHIAEVVYQELTVNFKAALLDSVYIRGESRCRYTREG